MKTKERILGEALKLYNQHGIRTITTRQIASAMSISPGNLHYHFKHTEDIIQALYGKMTGAFDRSFKELLNNSSPNLQTIDSYIAFSFELITTYKFIFINLVELGTWIPDIRKHYHQLIIQRESDCKILFGNLIRNGIFRSDIPDEIWTALVRQFFIVSDFWLSNNELTERLKGTMAYKQYSSMLRAVYFPYLSSGS